MSNEANRPIRVLTFIQKSGSLSDEQFQTYWKDVHGPRVLPFLKKHNVIYYSMTFTTAIPPEVSRATSFGATMETWDYHAVSNMVFQSAQDADAYSKDPEYIPIIKEDVEFMTQAGKMTVAFGNEEVLIDTMERAN